MIKAVPFIRTIGSEKFKEFLTLPFKADQVHTLDANCQVLFYGWNVIRQEIKTPHKDNADCIIYANQDGALLEFYSDGVYVIQKSFNAPVYQLPLPKTIDDFVNDMARCDIPLYWSKWVEENYEPKDYLPQEEINKYFIDLLNRMGKSQELS
jgi:hypothetical protein